MKQLYFLFALTLLWSCKEDPTLQLTDGFHEALFEQIQEQLISADPGSTISIPEGTFHFSRPLSLDGIEGITIAGAGMSKTVLSFKDQKVGAEGLKITADDVTIRDLTVQDTKGDCIKMQDCNGIVLKNVNTTWTGGALASNGGYGLYPVASKNVLIENCEASYASDAGIYVGQSEDVVVRNCYAHHNVAGIEIENCKRSEVYKNKAENNTGGILVFDLPDLPAGNGHSTKVYDNDILSNNHENFAPAGNIVATVPPGTGVILLAAKKVEVFNNRIKGHNTVGTSISSYLLTQRPFDPEQYDPMSYEIAVYDNVYDGAENSADTSTDMGKLVASLFEGNGRDIVYDGITGVATSVASNPMNICIGSNDGADFVNIDAMNGYAGLSVDPLAFACSDESRVKVEL